MEKEERINPHAYTQACVFFYLHQNKFSLSDTDGVKKKEIICFQVSLKIFLHLNSSAHFVVPFLFVVS